MITIKSEREIELAKLRREMLGIFEEDDIIAEEDEILISLGGILTGIFIN